MKENDSLTMKLRNICQDLEIAIDHIDKVLPDVRKDICICNVLSGYRDTLMDMFMVIGGDIIKRISKDGQ